MTVVLKITPTSFTASAGKLDSNNSYVFGDGGGNYYIPLGRICDFGIGTYRLALAGEVYDGDGYSGSFASPTTERVKVNGA